MREASSGMDPNMSEGYSGSEDQGVPDPIDLFTPDELAAEARGEDIDAGRFSDSTTQTAPAGTSPVPGRPTAGQSGVAAAESGDEVDVIEEVVVIAVPEEGDTRLP